MIIKALLAPGFEEAEAIGTIDIFNRAGYDVKTVSITDKNEVEGGHKIRIIADTILANENFNDTDGIFLPGGGEGVEHLAENKKVIETIKDLFIKKKVIMAICAAPYVLEKAGILKNKKITAYPSWLVKISSPTKITTAVVVDGNIITGRAMASTVEFALKCVEVLSGKEECEKIKKAIVYK
jgi:4-methyl-5(b-hydroxyethyl)-thiazole monophosphate biosynthesis